MTNEAEIRVTDEDDYIEMIARYKSNLQRLKAVVTDLDGTLWSTDHIPTKNCETITELRDSGIPLFVATGRSIQSVIRAARKFGVINLLSNHMYPGIYNDGALIRLSACRTLEHHTLDTRLKTQLFEIFKEVPGTQISIGANDIVYVETASNLYGGQQLTNWDEDIRIVDRLELIENVTAIALHGLFACSEGMAKIIHNGLSDQLDAVAYSDKFCLVVKHKFANKREATNKLLNHLKISPAETIVIGDGVNDISMLK